MKMYKLLNILVIGAVAAFITACGGGGIYNPDDSKVANSQMHKIDEGDKANSYHSLASVGDGFENLKKIDRWNLRVTQYIISLLEGDPDPAINHNLRVVDKNCSSEGSFKATISDDNSSVVIEANQECRFDSNKSYIKGKLTFTQFNKKAYKYLFDKFIDLSKDGVEIYFESGSIDINRSNGRSAISNFNGYVKYAGFTYEYKDYSYLETIDRVTIEGYIKPSYLNGWLKISLDLNINRGEDTKILFNLLKEKYTCTNNLIGKAKLLGKDNTYMNLDFTSDGISVDVNGNSDLFDIIPCFSDLPKRMEILMK